jgi:hypothetical protein
MDLKALCDQCRRIRAKEELCFAALIFTKRSPPAKVLAALPCREHARARALSDQRALELRQSRHNVEE